MRTRLVTACFALLASLPALAAAAPKLDALYDDFRRATEEPARLALAKNMQRKVISDANSVPVIWYSRIVAHVSNMKGWKIIPSHFANQDLGDIWLE